jgi:hypothetical protein
MCLFCLWYSINCVHMYVGWIKRIHKNLWSVLWVLPRFLKWLFPKWRFPKRWFPKRRFPKRWFPNNSSPNDVSPHDVSSNDIVPKIRPRAKAVIVTTYLDLTRVTDQAFGYYLTPVAGCPTQPPFLMIFTNCFSPKIGVFLENQC